MSLQTSASPPDDGEKLLIDWLKSRIEEVQSTYSRAKSSFEEKMYSVISEPLQIASNIVDHSTHNTAQEITAASNRLYYCNNMMLSILLGVYDNIEKHKQAFHEPQMCLGLRDSPCPLHSPNHALANPINTNSIHLDFGVELQASGQSYDHLLNEGNISLHNESEMNHEQDTLVNGAASNVEGGHHETISTTGDDEINHAELLKGTALSDVTRSQVECLKETVGLSSDIFNDENVAAYESTTETDCTEEPRAKSFDNLSTLSESRPETEVHPLPANEMIHTEDKCQDTHEYELGRASTVSLDGSITATLGRSHRICRSSSSKDFDLTEFTGVVSDVATPASFSIQKLSNLDSLTMLRDNMNRFYHDCGQGDSKLHLRNSPKPGDYCAVKYAIDNNWYRGRIMHTTGELTAIVEYIDYGNSDEILWGQAFKLRKDFQDIPRMSIKCCLSGVKPINTKKCEGDGRGWASASLEWFDQIIYDSRVDVFPIFKTNELLYVLLFTTDRTIEGIKRGQCISDLMVESGYADYDVREEEEVPVIALTENDLTEIRNERFSGSTSQANENSILPVDSNSKDTSITIVTDSKEKSTSSNIPHTLSEAKPNAKQQSSSSTTTSAESQHKKSNSGTADDLTGWNPLADDFESASNSYGVDNGNACMMMEGFDPEQVRVCKHYIRNKCWNGDRCPNVHPTTTENGEYKIQLPTFSCSEIPSLKLEEGNICIVRITKADVTKNFYVHVIKTFTNKQEFMQTKGIGHMQHRMSEDLHELSFDMERHSNGGTRNMKNLLQPVTGEMYIVYVRERHCYQRGMILQNHGVKSAPLELKVHLIDLGTDVVVNAGFLHPMSSAFMHLPKQAVQCTLWGRHEDDHPGLAKIADDAYSPNLVMRVMQVCEETDGPIEVTISSFNSNGLTRLF